VLTHVDATGLTLTHGTTYFFNIRARNGAGLVSVVASSDGVIVDTTAPGSVTNLIDGQIPGIDQVNQNSTTQLWATWTAATDAESGIVSYSAVVKNSQSVVLAQQTVTSSPVTFSGLSLAVGQTYTVEVVAQNGVGLVGASTATNGVTINPQLGDVDLSGQITLDDAVLLMSYLTGQTTLTQAQLGVSKVAPTSVTAPDVNDVNLIGRCAQGQLDKTQFAWCKN
jgi:hypothetical protein